MARCCPFCISTATRSIIPRLLARISHEELENLLRGYGWMPCFVEGSDPDSMHQAMAATVEHCIDEIREIRERSAQDRRGQRPRWPMIVLRSPKGWTAPQEVDGHRLEGSWRAHQVPLPDVKKNPEQLRLLENWMRSLKPEEAFDADGRLIPELKELAPTGTRRMSANPHANGGISRRLCACPISTITRQKVEQPGKIEAENTRPLGNFLRDIDEAKIWTISASSARTRPLPTSSTRFTRSPRNSGSRSDFPEDDDGGELAADGRVMEMLSEHTMEGMLEGYLLTGRHGFLSIYEAFVHVIDSMFNQHAKWLSICNHLSWRQDDRVAEPADYLDGVAAGS